MAKDIISTLSDFLLCHILSFLEAKHVVATAVLSKRWSNLWLYVHILEFYARLTDENTNFRFNDFVYSVLLSRDPAISIKRFKLFVDYDCEEDLNLPTLGFAKWINYVIQRGVQHLDLFLDLPSIPKLPNTIFSCKTLVSLVLTFFRLDHSFSSFQLPSLKTLNLEFIIIPKDLDFMLILAACPVLENLLVYDLQWLHSEDSLSCNKWKNFILSNLIDANVDSSYFHFPLKTLHNVQYLEISIAKMHSFSDFIPTFHNLTYLHLSCLNYRWHFLVEVLKHCPNLQDLDIDEAGAYATEETWTRKDDKENWMDPDFVPQCLSLHLRNCHLLNFFGLQGELLLAMYILKNARVLQIMEIWNYGQREIERLLDSCPRASSMCKLTVYHYPFDGRSEASLEARASSDGDSD
ncbi:unnamed protein product [Trifolium pratense]|uniref:Uncharacterized protein n=1 Tax=Trifolium pratense TaxID=57577 RepID=A0ACB0LNX6_TRIPR|nr:unnamed protein product [Trifolium pratense]